MDFIGTPFTGYRYEDIRDSLEDYFITPQCFESLITSRPTIFEGSRGFGKTTLLQSIEYKNNHEYLGVYYKVNDNITSHFTGHNYDEYFWIRLFSCYFVLSLSYQLSKLVCKLALENNLEKIEILNISERYFKIKSKDFNELSQIIYNQKESIIEFINNGSNGNKPYICNYAELIKEFPKAIISSNNVFKDKTVYYLIDEFENLNSWEQRCVLSLLKQHDKYHTFKIVTKPWGIIKYETIGGQQIQLVHDCTLVDLTKLNVDKKNHKKKTKDEDFFDFAKKVCNRRIEKYVKKIGVQYDEKLHDIEMYCAEMSYEDELLSLLKECGYKDELEKLKSSVSSYDDKEYIESLKDKPIDYCVLKLYLIRNNANPNVVEDAIDFIRSNSKEYKDMRDNYKMAFLYKYSKKHTKKLMNGFKDMVNYSGGNIRFLLEFCNELFSRLDINRETYICNKPDIKEQTRAVLEVAKSDLNAIKYSRNIDNKYLEVNAGLKIRTMIIGLGKIFSLIHKSDKISIIEPNHFIIKLEKGDRGELESGVIRECIMNGYFIAYENNKTKNRDELVLDEYMYKLHPLYCAFFGISWRQKNNITITLEQFIKLISGIPEEENEVMRGFSNKYSTEDLETKQYKFETF